MTQPLRLLIVEDDLNDFLLLRRALQRMETVRAASVSEAEAALERNTFDAVLLDYNLDGHVGFDLLARARRCAWHVPMIVLTGHDDASLEAKAIALGAVDFLHKDTIDAELIERAIRGAAKPEHRSSTTSLDGAGRLRILVVDDEPMMLKAMQRAIGNSHDIVSCTSGDAALARLASGEPFDMILTDVEMPKISGLGVFHEITKQHPAYASHVAFMTAGVIRPETEGELARVGRPLLQKPFSSAELRRFVGAFVARPAPT